MIVSPVDAVITRPSFDVALTSKKWKIKPGRAVGSVQVKVAAEAVLEIKLPLIVAVSVIAVATGLPGMMILEVPNVVEPVTVKVKSSPAVRVISPLEAPPAVKATAPSVVSRSKPPVISTFIAEA